MDIIPDRRSFPPLLVIIFLLALFVVGTWQGVGEISGALQTLAAYSSGNLTLPRNFALETLEYFITPVVAMLYIGLAKQQVWLNTPMMYRPRTQTLLTFLFVFTSVLALSFTDKSMFGFLTAAGFGILLGLCLKPVLGIAIVICLGACLTFLIWRVHGSVSAVTLGLMFQNILLLSFLLGLILRKVLPK